MPLGLPGLTTNKRLDLRVFELLDLLVGELKAVLLRGADLHDLEVVILEVRHLEVRREDGRAERDGVAREQQAIGFERLEDVAHRGSPALDRVEVELAFGMRLAADRPHQVFVHDPLVVDEHAVGNGIVVADDRVDKLVDEGVGIELEGLDRELDHLGQEGRARHVLVHREPRVEAPRDPAGLRHASDPGAYLHHPLAFEDRELAEQEEALAWRGGDPVGIAAAGIEEGRLRGLGGLLRQAPQLVLDLERAQGLELAQGREFSHLVLL